MRAMSGCCNIVVRALVDNFSSSDIDFQQLQLFTFFLLDKLWQCLMPDFLQTNQNVPDL